MLKALNTTPEEVPVMTTLAVWLPPVGGAKIAGNAKSRSSLPSKCKLVLSSMSRPAMVCPSNARTPRETPMSVR